MIYASIITIGDELLIGQVTDTNSAWMAQELNKAGIMVKRRVAVGDSATEIRKALDQESDHADIILITGGLGPTADDITKPLLCEYFNGKMIVDEGALANVKYLFESVFKRPVTERNLKQAEVPDNCSVIQNRRGSAPGMCFERAGKIFVSMPGVPYEMKGMMEEKVISLLQAKFRMAHIAHRTLVTFGIGESMIADMITDFETALPENIKLAYLPNSGMVRLRLTATTASDNFNDDEIDQQFLQLQYLLRKYMISAADQTMEQILSNLLLQKNKKLSTAESCTGGYIAHLLTAIPGASLFYNGSIISYSNDVKKALLGVNEEPILAGGVVSEAVVVEMAKGAIRQTGTDYAIAVSGIMGPDGGTPDKPVGTVWIAAGSMDKQLTGRFHFRYDRQRNIQLTAMNALNLLRGFILMEEQA